MSDLVLRNDDDGLCTLTLNRPDKLNALTVAVFKQLRAHVDALAEQVDSIGCVVLRGSARAFSAGNDLKDIQSGERAPHPDYQAETIEALANLPQPVISAVSGHCYTGGLELALAGDLIIASESAKLADTHGKWGLTPKWGMSQRLPRLVGSAKAKELMFTSRTLSGREAEAIGLVNACVSDADFDAEVESLARRILANSWHSNRANKHLVDASDGMTLEEGLRFEIAKSPGMGPDSRERMARFGRKS